MILRSAKYIILITALLGVTAVSAYLTLIFLIKSEDSVIVPDLVGRDVIYALEILTDLGLNIKVKGSEYSGDIAKNHVIFQEPGPGAEIKVGRDVRILLSKGTKNILMPNLKGLSIRHANLAIQENGLCQGRTSYTHYGQSLARDAVISQVPGPDQWVNRGSCVDLLVSLGPRPRAFEMRKLEGLSLDEAVYLVEQSNLAVGNIKYAYDRSKAEHTIIDQMPKYGYRITEKETVDLVVNRNPAGQKRVAGQDESSQGVFVHRLAPGFFKRRVQVKLELSGITGEIFDELVEPGKEVWLIVPTSTPATLFCYVDGELVRTQRYSPD